MTHSQIITSSSHTWHRLDLWVLYVLIILTLARISALLMTPLSLGVDEAQYWVWSQNLDFGYYSKPPLIAWIIGISHGVFGHSSWAVRLPAPILQLAISLLLWRAAGLIFTASAGRIAALLWSVMPAVGLGSLVISTDTPMLFFWSIGLVCLIESDHRNHKSFTWLFAAGLAAGCAMLSKYAALYFLLGASLYLCLTLKARTLRLLPALLAGFFIAASPNLIWNLTNSFVTFQHLGENANLSVPAYSLAQLGRFIGGQFFVFGPLTLGLALVAFYKQQKARLFLACFSLPVLAIMCVQAFLKEANANWAVSAYPAITILLAGWLSTASGLRHWMSRTGLLAIAINAGLVFVVTVSVALGDFGRFTPKSDPLRRLRGWEALAADMVPYIDTYQVKTILADSRAAAAILPFHLYPRDIVVRLFDHDNTPTNHFERAYNFTPESTSPTLAITAPDTRPRPDFVTWTGPVGQSDIKISARRHRTKLFYISQ